MALDDRTAQAQLTPEERRELLRAFADRMLLKVTTMDDPEDMPGVEKAVRVAAIIKRIYSRCDRTEHHAPDPRKLEAERATNKSEAIKARVELANTLEWGDRRRKGLGQWWEAAQTAAQEQTPNLVPAWMQAAVQVSAQTAPQKASETPAPQDAAALERPTPDSFPDTYEVNYIDYTDRIHEARADLGLKDISAAAPAKPAQKPPPPA